MSAEELLSKRRTSEGWRRRQRAKTERYRRKRREIYAQRATEERILNVSDMELDQNDDEALRKKLEEEQEERERLESLQRRALWLENAQRIKAEAEERNQRLENLAKMEKASKDTSSKRDSRKESSEKQVKSMRSIEYESNKQSDICPNFEKTGACRFGDSCKMYHEPVDTTKGSCTLLFRNMFRYQESTSLDEPTLKPFPTPNEMSAYSDFFDDLHPELVKHGRLVQLKVCRNEAPHLRGNVYVQYSNVNEARAAQAAFSRRMYDGQVLHPQFVNVWRWRVAVCPLFEKSRCNKGVDCNLLHPYHNPNQMYATTDANDGVIKLPELPPISHASSTMSPLEILQMRAFSRPPYHTN